MFSEQVMEQHYTAMPTDELQTIRNEYQWVNDVGGVDKVKQMLCIDNILSERTKSQSSGVTHQILFLCKCGQSRIVKTNTAENKIRAYVFEQFNVPCPRCRSVNNYTWKFMDH